MHRGQRLRRCASVLVLATALAGMLAVPSAAGAKAGPPSGLSPRLAKLASPSLRTASNADQAKGVGLVPSGPGSLLRHGRRVVVHVRFDHGAVAGLPALRAAGGEVVDSSRRYQSVTAAVTPADLPAVGRVANVASVTEAHAPFTSLTCPSPGSVVSEGVGQLNAGTGSGEARGKYGVDGSGVTVGILSDSFDSATEAADGSGPVETHAEEDEESGDLPGPNSPCGGEEVEVLDEIAAEEEGFDEGRGMAQIVHDLAPGAKIDFATAFKPDMFGFAENIEKLAEEAEADVIADDVFYFEEPFFQDGPVAVAVNEAVKGGTAYFSAAGNDNIISEGHDIASWETPDYRDAGSCPPEVAGLSGFNAAHCLDFNPGAGVDKTFGIKVEPRSVLSVDLQWSEPWFGVETDLDVFLLNSEGRLIAREFVDNVETQQPTEILQWINGSSSTKTVQLVINRFAGESAVPLKFGLLENGSGVAATEYPRSTGEDVVGPTIFGHSGSAAAVSVGAIRFNTKSAPEEYSSRGPVRHDFGPVEGTEPAEPISEELSKPDLVGTDCGLTTFFAQFVIGQGWRFCGTSAAAPHAAGVAALMLDEKSTATPTQIRTALQAGALPVGEFDACAVGAGMIDATVAIEDLLSPPVFSAEECELPAPGDPEEARAPGDWGLEIPPLPPPPTTSMPAPLPLPRTFIRKKPPHIVRTRTRRARVVFVFGSNQTGVTFACRIDTSPFKLCKERLVRRFKVGPHVLRVFARNASGNGDPTPAAYRFRVKHVG